MNVETLYADEEPVGPASPASIFIRRLVTVLWWANWAAFALFCSAILIATLGLIGVEPIKSQAFTESDPITAFIMALTALIYVSVLLVILRQLLHICKTLTSGDPFVPENARRLRVIWIAIAAGEILRQIGTLFFAKLNNDGVIAYAPAADSATSGITFEVRIYVWFLVLAFVIFAEVFREGARLRQEQKLTV